MRLGELLLTLSLFLLDVNGNEIHSSCSEESPSVIQTIDGKPHINSTISEIRCFVYDENKLNCSWDTDSLPEDAQYSALIYVSEEQPLELSLRCVSDSSKKLVKCHAEEDFNDLISVVVNITINGYWYVICQKHEASEIELLNPPQKITVLKKSENLEIQWSQTRSCCSPKSKCFNYTVKINDKLVDLMGELAYNLTNYDPTKSYDIQIRTIIKDTCVSNSQWSDWSRPITFSPVRSTSYQLNPGVIASIVFVLPMILLAFLLVCKFQRLFDKLFPSIPNPSKNVQMILEKDYYNQDMPSKQCEEGGEILMVIG